MSSNMDAFGALVGGLLIYKTAMHIFEDANLVEKARR